MSRVSNEDRRERGKLTDPGRLVEMYDLTAALPFEPQLHLETTRLAPKEAAARIATYFALPVLPDG